MTKEKQYKWCHSQPLPLASGRKQKAKQKVLARRAPAGPASGHTFLVHCWGTLPKLQGGNLQNISSKSSGRSSFSFPSAATSQASAPSDSLSGYQPRSLTLEVADKRFHVKTDRQNWQEPTATAAWLQVLVGTEPETNCHTQGVQTQLPCLGSFWHVRSLGLGRAAGQCSNTDLSSLIYPQGLIRLYQCWGCGTAIQNNYLVLQLRSQAIICHSHREHLSPFSQPLNEWYPTHTPIVGKCLLTQVRYYQEFWQFHFKLPYTSGKSFLTNRAVKKQPKK